MRKKKAELPDRKKRKNFELNISCSWLPINILSFADKFVEMN